MNVKHTHYTNFGVNMTPNCADQEGYVEYREGYEALDEAEWTDGELWIMEASARVDEWRESNA